LISFALIDTWAGLTGEYFDNLAKTLEKMEAEDNSVSAEHSVAVLADHSAHVSISAKEIKGSSPRSWRDYQNIRPSNRFCDLAEWREESRPEGWAPVAGCAHARLGPSHQPYCAHYRGRGLGGLDDIFA
jgi:hypothetical protein